MDDEDRTQRSLEPTAEQVAREVLGRDVAKLLANDPIARRGIDPEGVHQMRVASRHLRSELRLLSPALRSKAIAPLRSELRWLTGSLGTARDADVRAERSDELLSLIRAPSSVAHALRQSDRVAHRRAYDALGSVLGSKRYRTMVERLSRLAIDPPLTKLGVVPARGILTPGLRQMASHLDGLVAQLDPSPSAPALHGVRIAAKRLRYGASVAGLFAGMEADSAADALGEVQDLLGEGRDAAMSIDRLHRLGLEDAAFGPASDEGLKVAAMVEIEQARIRETEECWPAAYSRARAHLVVLKWLQSE